MKMDVTGVTLSSTSETLKKGATVTLSAAVSSGGATNADVTWKSTNTSVARVDQSGKVTALADGAAAITVEADGKFAVCVVLVSSGANDGDNDDGDDGNTGGSDTQPSATPTVAPTATTTPADSGDKEDVPDTGDDTPKPTPAPEAVIITIVVADLPEGTTAVRLPDGTVIELDGSDTIDIKVDAEQLSDDGSLDVYIINALSSWIFTNMDKRISLLERSE